MKKMFVAIIVDVINILPGTRVLLELALCLPPILHHSTPFIFSSTELTPR